MLRYHGARGSIAANNEMMDVEDRFDVLVDANDQLLERVVSFVAVYFLQNFREHLERDITTIM